MACRILPTNPNFCQLIPQDFPSFSFVEGSPKTAAVLGHHNPSLFDNGTQNKSSLAALTQPFRVCNRLCMDCVVPEENHRKMGQCDFLHLSFSRHRNQRRSLNGLEAHSGRRSGDESSTKLDYVQISLSVLILLHECTTYARLSSYLLSRHFCQFLPYSSFLRSSFVGASPMISTVLGHHNPFLFNGGTQYNSSS